MRVLPGSASRSRRGRRRLPGLVVALLVILGTAAVTFYAFNGGLPFTHQFTLSAVVGNSVNVRDGDPVRIDGVDVGQVSAVSAQGTQSRITFTLDGSALPIHRDATLRIRDRLFLEGSYYLALDPGTPEAPVLKDGNTIPVSHTSGPVQLYQVLSLFTAPVRQSLVGSMNQLAKGFAQPSGSLAQSGTGAIKRAAPQFAPLLKDTALITQGLRGTAPGDLPRLLHSTASVMGTLAGSATQLTSLVRGVNTTAGALVSSDGALARSIRGVDQTLAAAPPALRAVNGALPAVRQLAITLDPSLVVAPPILEHLTATVGRLAAVLAPAERGPLLSSLDATFRQLPSILTELAKAFPIGKQVTDCLNTHVLPIIRRRVPDGSLSTGQTVLQDFLHFLPGLAGASGSFDGDGPYTRFVAGAGTNSLTGSFAGKRVTATLPSGGQAIQGARPRWFGDLQPGDFRPDARCAVQKVPSLASTTAPPDLRSKP
jgi:phospholipid/cholesterol/gamma-HCH transport system substrate-binding protein